MSINFNNTGAYGYSVGTDLDDLTTLTISAWVLANSFPERTACVVTKDDYGITDRGFALLYSSFYTNFYWDVAYDDTNNMDGVRYQASLNTGRWYHILARWKATHRDIWLDGIEGDSDTNIRTSISDTAANLIIGDQENDTPAGNYWDGIIAHVVGWNTYFPDRDIIDLSRGKHPMHLRQYAPQRLFYMPLPSVAHPNDYSINRYEADLYQAGHANDISPPVEEYESTRPRVWPSVKLEEEVVETRAIILPKPRTSRPPSSNFRLNKDSEQAEGLVGWWPISASPLSSLRDYSGRNFHISGLTGTPSLVLTRLGHGIEFTGTQYYQSNLPSWFDITAPWTISGFVRFDNPADDYPPAFGFENSANDEFISIGADATTSSLLKIITLGETPGAGSTTLIAGNFYHFTLVYDGTDFLSYVDGQFDYSVTPTGSDWQTSDRIFIAGHGSAMDVFEGIVHNIVLHDHALGAAEIHHLWNPPTRWELYEPIRPTFWPISIALGGPLPLENITTASVTGSEDPLVLLSTLPTVSETAGEVGEVVISGAIEPDPTASETGSDFYRTTTIESPTTISVTESDRVEFLTFNNLTTASDTGGDSTLLLTHSPVTVSVTGGNSSLLTVRTPETTISVTDSSSILHIVRYGYTTASVTESDFSIVWLTVNAITASITGGDLTCLPYFTAVTASVTGSKLQPLAIYPEPTTSNTGSAENTLLVGTSTSASDTGGDENTLLVGTSTSQSITGGESTTTKTYTGTTVSITGGLLGSIAIITSPTVSETAGEVGSVQIVGGAITPSPTISETESDGQTIKSFGTVDVSVSDTAGEGTLFFAASDTTISEGQNDSQLYISGRGVTISISQAVAGQTVFSNTSTTASITGEDFDGLAHIAYSSSTRSITESANWTYSLYYSGASSSVTGSEIILIKSFSDAEETASVTDGAGKVLTLLAFAPTVSETFGEIGLVCVSWLLSPLETISETNGSLSAIIVVVTDVTTASITGGDAHATLVLCYPDESVSVTEGPIGWAGVTGTLEPYYPEASVSTTGSLIGWAGTALHDLVDFEVEIERTMDFDLSITTSMDFEVEL